MVIIYCDGGSRGNPGPAASAFVVNDNEKLIHKGSKYLGIETNNVAEYSAVLIALDWVIKEELKDEIIINLDSQLIERQINGFYKVKNERLQQLYLEVKEKLTRISKTCNCVVKFVWNYRTNNELADNLVNEELDKNK